MSSDTLVCFCLCVLNTTKQWCAQSPVCCASLQQQFSVQCLSVFVGLLDLTLFGVVALKWQLRQRQFFFVCFVFAAVTVLILSLGEHRYKLLFAIFHTCQPRQFTGIKKKSLIILGEYGNTGKWIQENIIFMRYCCCFKLSKKIFKNNCQMSCQHMSSPNAY